MGPTRWWAQQIQWRFLLSKQPAFWYHPTFIVGSCGWCTPPVDALDEKLCKLPPASKDRSRFKTERLKPRFLRNVFFQFKVMFKPHHGYALGLPNVVILLFALSPEKIFQEMAGKGGKNIWAKKAIPWCTKNIELCNVSQKYFMLVPYVGPMFVHLLPIDVLAKKNHRNA